MELPIDGPLLFIDACGPSIDLELESIQAADAASSEALPGHGTQFTFGHIEPTAMFRCVHRADACAYDAASEDELGRLLRQSESFDGFVRSLIQHGYHMLAGGFSAPPRLSGIYKLIEDELVVAILSAQGNGYAVLQDTSIEAGPLHGFALTVYVPQAVPSLLRLAQSSHSFSEFLNSLEKSSFQAIETTYGS